MAAAAVVLSANAQRLVSQRFLGQLENAITGTTTIPRSNKLPKKANLAANQRLVGYYATDDVDNSLGVGNYTTADIEPAIFLEQSALAPYVGKKVTAVRFSMGANSTAKGVAIYSVDAEGNINALVSKDTTIVSKSTKPPTYGIRSCFLPTSNST